MSFLHLKNKLEPQYKELHTAAVHKDVFVAEPKKDNSNNSLIIGQNINITGTIQADSGEVIIHGNINGDIDCHVAKIKKSGTVKGSIKAQQLCVEGKVEGEFNIAEMLHIKTEGRIDGKITYGGIQCDGGRLSGEVKHSESNKIKQKEFKDLKAL